MSTPEDDDDVAASGLTPDAHEMAAPGQPVSRAETDRRRPPVLRGQAPAPPPTALEKLRAEIGAAHSLVTGLHARAVDRSVGDEAIGRPYGAVGHIAEALDGVRADIMRRRSAPAPAIGTVREFTAADPDCPTDVIGQRDPGWYYWTGERWDGQAATKAQAEHYARIGAITR